jgi:hypothetical protein
MEKNRLVNIARIVYWVRDNTGHTRGLSGLAYKCLGYLDSIPSWSVFVWENAIVNESNDCDQTICLKAI